MEQEIMFNWSIQYAKVERQGERPCERTVKCSALYKTGL